MRGYYGYSSFVGQQSASQAPPPIRNPLTKTTPLVVLRSQAFAAAQQILPPEGWSNYVLAIIWDGFPVATAFNHQDKNSAINALFEWLDPDPYGPPAHFLYVAVFDATDPRWPRPINEATGPGYAPVVIPQGKPTMPATWRLREATKVRSEGWPWSYPYVGQQAPPPGPQQPQSQYPYTVPYDAGPAGPQKPRGPLIPGTSVPDPMRSTLDGALATMTSDDVQRYLISCLKNLDARGASYFDSVLLLLYLAINEAARFGYTTADMQKLVAGLVAASGYQRPDAERTARRRTVFSAKTRP